MTIPIELLVAVVTAISTITAAGIAKKWVWGWTYAEMVEDRNFWRGIALDSTGNASEALNLGTAIVRRKAARGDG